MPEYPMNVSIRRIPKDANLFEITITTPTLRSQFRLPRDKMNELRVTIEQALMDKRR
ncbi:MAG: hypothetical protein JW844_00710 [Candidatus Omnitrophica bacterium]|nr:hypothetical protein [Candidatus Omnitrophota bacterium]